MKKCAAAWVLMVLLAATNASAAVGPEDINLGGICPGMSYEEVVARYGAPTREEKGYAQLVSRVIFYGQSVEIGFLGNSVRYVTSTANNGWSTPAGIHVGMPLVEVFSILGEDYQTRNPPANRPESMLQSPFYDLRWQGIRYDYSCLPDVYTYEPGDTSWILSVTSGGREDRVAAVTIRQRTPEY